MEFPVDKDIYVTSQSDRPICRCCLTPKTVMNNIKFYTTFIMELAGITVSPGDGLPQWMCNECIALLFKSVRFKRKVTSAHNLLCQHLIKCTPFPVHNQDEELAKYASPNLSSTVTTVLNLSEDIEDRFGFSDILQHEKRISKSEMIPFEVQSDSLGNIQNSENGSVLVKSENDFSDYEDNIALEELRIMDKDVDIKEEVNFYQVRKKKKTKSKENNIFRKSYVKKKENISRNGKVRSEMKSKLEIDPTKIRIIILNPEEQIKQSQKERLACNFPFKCPLCHAGFNFESKLENHMAKHSPSRGKPECKLCKMHFPTRYSLKVHNLIHTRRYECLACSIRMIDRASIIHHYRTKHEGVLQLFTCNLCGKVSNNKQTHNGHLRNHHSGERPACDACGKSFVNADSLAEHKLIHEGVKNCECPQCGKRFRTRNQFKHHQLSHTDAKNFYCVECDARFKSAHTLRQHLINSLRHKDPQSFKHACASCPKRYETARALEGHVRVQHEGARPHACELCPAALASRGSLAKHMRAVHAGQRAPAAHQCHACGKAFRSKFVLANHVRTHTGEKPFECAECGRKFSQRASMKTHVQLVHLKIRRRDKMKSTQNMEQVPATEMFCKEEHPPSYQWSKPEAVDSCQVYFTVTAGPN